MTQETRALDFLALHQPTAESILVLPNAWDAMSARLVEQAGARAIATTSSGVSWALGRPDGHGVTRHEMIEAIRRIERAVAMPVTADVEGGYGAGAPTDVADTVRGVVDAGAVGINLEDSLSREKGVLVEIARQVERIAAARKAADTAGIQLFINARTDVYLRQFGAKESRVAETVRRAEAYLAAGANGIFVPGLVDVPTIKTLAQQIAAPLNIMAGPGAPAVGVLRGLGVARVSVGPSLALAIMAHLKRAAGELLRDGTYERMSDAYPFAEANELFKPGGN